MKRQTERRRQAQGASLAATRLLVTTPAPARTRRVAQPGANADENDRCVLHGGNPHQRVIPRVDRIVHVVFGERTWFRLIWNPKATEERDPQVQERLVQLANSLAIPGFTFSGPVEARATTQIALSSGERPISELRSRYTSSVPAGQTKQVHKYRIIGSGTYGEVWKVADLASGKLWALRYGSTYLKGQSKLVMG